MIIRKPFKFLIEHFKIINVNETNKQGLEQTSFSTCTDK